MINTKKAEMLTDKQILKRLNAEVVKSKVMTGYDVKKLPKIIRREAVAVNANPFWNTNAKKNKVKVKLKNDNDDDSDISEEAEDLDVDLFMDRCED